MIVIVLHYVVPIEQIDAHRAAHLAWLRDAADDGRLLFAGRQVPLTGGMIAARGTRAEVEAWAATDPFALNGLAEYSFIEVAPSIVAPGLEALAQ
ncbi:GTP cyclohydrolase [Sphingomonas sp. Leaf231]|uniref:YciI family protein n=1 Tax=Sphingomonas sp. Leaf231 TaxID=1736301 RepID=UPI0006F9A0D8|nr:YciI family protein [Sphingomonas sp. Leaf231]KQN93113.1 GTP cyclohydrolase [Sphingomonas sp. Leaf231]